MTTDRAGQPATGNSRPQAGPVPNQELHGSWQLDPEQSSVEFRVKLLGGLNTVRGRFEAIRGHLNLRVDPAIKLSLESASIETGNRRRDKHLRSKDFLAADQHPQVQFVSDAVDVVEDRLVVRGRLSAAGGSIPMELEAQVRQLGQGLEIITNATIPHRDLGITYSPLGLVSPVTEVTVRARLMRVTEPVG